MNFLAMFLVAMTGPVNPKDFGRYDYTGCKLSSWKSESCYQRPGEPKKCETADSGDVYDCRNIDPGFLAFDFNKDLVVDLKDYAWIQNHWGE